MELLGAGEGRDAGEASCVSLKLCAAGVAGEVERKERLG